MLLTEIANVGPDLHRPHALKHGMQLWGTSASTEEEIAALIQKHCSAMLEAYRQIGEPLYRGISSKDLAVGAKIRADRLPVEMPYRAHRVLADIFSELGLDANRSNSIFCSMNRSVADTWGYPYIVFVEDGWTATVFNKVKRGYVFDEIIDIANEMSFDDEGNPRTPEQIAAKRESLKMTLQALGPRNVDTIAELEDVLIQKYEDVLVHGSRYIGLRVDEPATDRILELLGISQ